MYTGELLPSALAVVAALVAMPAGYSSLSTLQPATGGGGQGSGQGGGQGSGDGALNILRLLEPGRVGTDLRQHGAWEYVTEPAVVWRGRLGTLPPIGDAGAALTAVRVVGAAVPTAVCFWFESQLGEGAPLLSSSPSSHTHWRQVLVPLPEGAQRTWQRTPLQPGSEVTLRAMLAAHDEFQIDLVPLPPPPEPEEDGACEGRGDVCEPCEE